MSKKIPFFTIAIPSLNRIDSLKLVIESILCQTLTNYELLIVDDNSSDSIEKYIKSLRSKKISFIKNKNRMGFKYTYTKCLLAAKGKYVLTLGNDDVLCDKNTLADVYKKLVHKKNVGLAKIPTVFYFKQIDMPCFSQKLEKEDMYIPKTDYVSLFKAIDDYSLTHIAGNIYLRELVKESDVLDNDLIPFFKILVECAAQKGFFLIADQYIAVAMSTSYLPLFFKKEINNESWFYVNYRIYSQYIAQNTAKQLVLEKMKERFPFFISHKSYMGSRALVFLVKEYMTFDKSFQFNLKMWASFFIALIFPRKLFFILRDRYYNRMVSRFTAPSKYYEALRLIK